jgi:hypothetical protein
MYEQKRAFKGIWIPIEIWDNTDLEILEKILLADIESDCSNHQVCFADVNYWVWLLQVKERKVKHLLASLEWKGFIESTTVDGKHVIRICRERLV